MEGGEPRHDAFKVACRGLLKVGVHFDSLWMNWGHFSFDEWLMGLPGFDAGRSRNVNC